MMKFKVDGQIISVVKFEQPVADSVDYLTAEFEFSADWSGATKTAYFQQGTIRNPFVLSDDKITSDMHLNLTSGTWSVSVVGISGGAKITTNTVSVSVFQSGVKGGNSVEVNMTQAEQMLSVINSAAEYLERKTDDINFLTSSVGNIRKIEITKKKYYRTPIAGDLGSLELSPASGRQCGYTTVKKGDVVVISGMAINNGAARAYCFLDNNLISQGRPEEIQEIRLDRYEVTAPCDGYVLVNFLNPDGVADLDPAKLPDYDVEAFVKSYPNITVSVPFETADGLIQISDGSVYKSSTSVHTVLDCTDAKYIAFRTSNYNGEYGYVFLDSDDNVLVGYRTTTTSRRLIPVPNGAKTFKVCWIKTAFTQEIQFTKSLDTAVKGIYKMLSWVEPSASMMSFNYDEDGEE